MIVAEHQPIEWRIVEPKTEWECWQIKARNLRTGRWMVAVSRMGSREDCVAWLESREIAI